MITLISTLIGLFSPIIPALVKMFEKSQDNKYELELRKLEIEAAERGIALQARIQQIQATIDANKALYVHDESLIGNDWINNLRASVRPIITYSFFGLFCIIKLALGYAAYMAGADITQLANVVWDEYTASLFGAIMGFWFGSRLWEKQSIIPAVTENNRLMKLFRTMREDK